MPNDIDTNLLLGKAMAKDIRASLAEEAQSMTKRLGQPLKLATIRIGDFDDARLYANSIDKLLGRFEITHQAIELDANSSSESVIAKIDELIADNSLGGILLLSPLPEHLNYNAIIEHIPAVLDSEGTRYAGVNQAEAYPPTALALFEAIKAAKRPIEGLQAVVVGRSRIVGKPVADLLLKANATVTICHSKTTDLAQYIRMADIVVAAVGKAKIIKGDWIKPGAIVVDAGENVIDGELFGDVEFEIAKTKAGFITPVPGGIGPLTSLMLIKNLLALYKQKS
ncbi:MAG: methylenetetrahydrofolate dehydrogenase (NADP+)/methenyltetrahydrofolate cyclohydrolase [Candidatus Omnitrophota bacterium]|jgi:methylenetetrahydrofolate dehydrogenase (NADP+)/methenyltetrahydrofolate cyclohydrolase